MMTSTLLPSLALLQFFEFKKIMKCKYCDNDLEELKIDDDESDIHITLYVCNVCDVVYIKNSQKLEEI